MAPRSTRTTFAPIWAAPAATDNPPDPAPITHKSGVSFSVITANPTRLAVWALRLLYPGAPKLGDTLGQKVVSDSDIQGLLLRFESILIHFNIGGRAQSIYHFAYQLTAETIDTFFEGRDRHWALFLRFDHMPAKRGFDR